MRNSKIREEAILEIWKSCEDSPEYKGLEPLELISEADGGRRRHVRRRVVFAVAELAVACIAGLCIFLAGSYSGSEVCLASGERSKGYFVLPDKSVVWLNNGSRLYYKKNLPGRTRRVRLEGEGYFEVAPNPDRPFVVNTEKINVFVLGTKFSIRAYKQKPLTVCLKEGSVKVDSPEFTPLVMKPGELLCETERNWSLRRVRVENHTAWANDEISFDCLPAKDIVQCLEHWYNVEFSLRNESDFNDIKLSFSVKYEPLEEILEAIGLISGIRYSIIDADHVQLYLD